MPHRRIRLPSDFQDTVRSRRVARRHSVYLPVARESLLGPIRDHSSTRINLRNARPPHQPQKIPSTNSVQRGDALTLPSSTGTSELNFTKSPPEERSVCLAGDGVDSLLCHDLYSQYLRIFCPCITHRPQYSHFAESHRTKLFEEGNSFLGSGDSGEPIVLIGLYLLG